MLEKEPQGLSFAGAIINRGRPDGRVTDTFSALDRSTPGQKGAFPLHKLLVSKAELVSPPRPLYRTIVGDFPVFWAVSVFSHIFFPKENTSIISSKNLLALFQLHSKHSSARCSVIIGSSHHSFFSCRPLQYNVKAKILCNTLLFPDLILPTPF
jgi:hypothetical protein